ncbi:MAG: putative site-specific recombinase, partial [Pseudomonadota bacterium]
MQLLTSKDTSGLIANYLQHVRVGKRLASKTVDLYAHELAKLQSLCAEQNVALTDVQHIHIRRWVASSHSSGKGAKTLALQLSSWRGFYKWLVASGEIVHNPCLDIKPPKAAKPLPKALGVDAAMALAQYRTQIPTPLSADADIYPTAQGQTNTSNADLVLPYAIGGMSQSDRGVLPHTKSFTLPLDNGSQITVAITLDATTRSAKIDFTGTSPQQTNNFNAPRAV